MIKLGITGGIGSGKSYVSRLLIERGIPVFDCDAQAKQLTNSNPAIRSGLIGLLGSEVYLPTGLNKPILAAYLFASKENAAKINAIIHPCVREAFRIWAAEREAEGMRLIAMESAILYESGFNEEVDKVMMVYAPLEVRCSRVIARDHTTMEAVRKRIAAQMSDDDKCKVADFLIENDGVQSLNDQLDKTFSCLKIIKENE